MKLIIFSVYDSAAKAFIPPFFMTDRALAVRVFGDCANTPDHHFCKFPNDFCLYEIGEFDDLTGEILNYPVKENLGLAASFQVKVPAPDFSNFEGSN